MNKNHQAVHDLSKYDLGWTDELKYEIKPEKGLNESVVNLISDVKKEPQWLREFRLKSLKTFRKKQKQMPKWVAPYIDIDFEDIYYYLKPESEKATSWDDIPDKIKTTYERLGIPEAERKFLAGVSAQYDSEMVYHKNRKDLEEKGILFTDMDTAIQEYPEIVRKYFAKVIPPGDNIMSALNSAVLSGGSFIYVPPGVKVDQPLQAYFRINSENAGQFERTLIIADEGAEVTYFEGCSASIYSTDTLHSAVVELVALPNSKIKYMTIQNWSDNVYNLVTKRGIAHENASIQWLDVNVGCIAEGEKITTKKGLIPIENIEIGTEVLSYNESIQEMVWSKVTAKKDSGIQNVFETGFGMRTIKTTANHPFLSYTYDSNKPSKLGRYAIDYVKAEELSHVITPNQVPDYGVPYKLKKPSLVTVIKSGNQYTEKGSFSYLRETKIDKIEYTTDDLMWLFGLFIGDGSISCTKTKTGEIRFGALQFSIPQNNQARKKLVQVMLNLFPKISYNERKDGVLIYWSSKELIEFFECNGFSTGAHSKRLPKWILDLPESQKAAFIAGYMDSDGCVPKERTNLTIKSVNYELLSDTSEILISLGITPRIWTEFEEDREVLIMGNKVTARGSHTLSFPSDKRIIKKLCDKSQQKFNQREKPKRVNFKQIGRSSITLPDFMENREIEKQIPLGRMQTWDIEVEATGNFVCEGFIVHNSHLTMKYPAVYLAGRKAKGEVISAAWAGQNQIQDTGAKMIHMADETTSRIDARSISANGGRSSYRGLVHIDNNLTGCRSSINCDALIMDTDSRTDTYPYMEIGSKDSIVEHEASVTKLNDDQIFYLRSRGLSERQAQAMIVNGFMESVHKHLPMEYSVEFSRLMELNLEDAVG